VRPTVGWIEEHPGAEARLRIWLKIMERRSYTGPGELKADFASVSFLGAGCTVFNIGGNKFRLVVTSTRPTERSVPEAEPATDHQ
jgi:mRNA-degrading endonuclease HigB of HigAB toxin-antitoxin module